MDNGNKYFKEKMSKNLHNATCKILIDGWQLLMLAWHHGCNNNGIA
jgi:hypothetical protein